MRSRRSHRRTIPAPHDSRLRVPTEYVSWETGERRRSSTTLGKIPTTTDHLYFTSFAETLTVGGHDYAPEPITHGELRTGLKADTESLQIDSVIFDDNPSRTVRALHAPVPAHVEIIETTLPMLNAPTTLFAARSNPSRRRAVSSPPTVSASSTRSRRKLPRHVFQTRCNYALFEPSTCNYRAADSPSPPPSPPSTHRPDHCHRLGRPRSCDALVHRRLDSRSAPATPRKSARSKIRPASTPPPTIEPHPAAVREYRRRIAHCTARLRQTQVTCQTKFDNFANFGACLSANRQPDRPRRQRQPRTVDKEMTGTRTIYRPFFKTIARKMDLIREARSWLRTPFATTAP